MRRPKNFVHKNQVVSGQCLTRRNCLFVVEQNGESNCRRVPHGRAGAQVLRGPLLVLPAAALHHFHHARRGTSRLALLFTYYLRLLLMRDRDAMRA